MESIFMPCSVIPIPCGLDGIEKILTCLGFKPTQSHPIHMDREQNEQALMVTSSDSQRISQYFLLFLVQELNYWHCRFLWLFSLCL
jgi:hypothetical protein